MDLGSVVKALITEHGGDKTVITNLGEMTLLELSKHPNFSDGRFNGMDVGLKDENTCCVRLSEGKTSGPIFTIKQ